MRPTRGESIARAAHVLGPLLVLTLAACSSSSQPDLPAYTGGTGFSTSVPSTSSATLSATTRPTPSNPPTAAATAFPATSTIVRGGVAASIPSSSRPAVDAFYAYWDYVAKAGLDPAAAGALENIGTVATGSAASNLVSKIGGLNGRGQHTVGSTAVGISSLSESGGTATVCSPVHDTSVDVDAQGIPVEAPVPKFVTFKTTLVKQGPSWLVTSNGPTQTC